MKASVSILLLCVLACFGAPPPPGGTGSTLRLSTSLPLGPGASLSVSNDSIIRPDAVLLVDHTASIPGIITNTVGTGLGRLLVATLSLSSATSGNTVTQCQCRTSTTTNNMTRGGYVRPNGSATSGEISLWYLANPTAGENLIYIEANSTATDRLIANCLSFSNANSASLTVATNQGSGTTASISSTLTSGDMSVSVHGSGSGVTSFTGFKRWSTNFSGATGAGNAACTTSNGVGTITHQFNITSDSYGNVLLSMPHN